VAADAAARLNRLRTDEGGAILVTFAIFLPLSMVIAALVFDAGFAWGLKRHLQASADAAALAAVQELPMNATSATAMANAYSASAGGRNHRAALPTVATQVQILDDANQVCVTNCTKVRVTQSAASPTWFARLMGLNKVDVSAFAVASVVQTGSTSNQILHAHGTNCGNQTLKLNGNNIDIQGHARSNGKFELNGNNMQVSSASAKNCGGSGPIVNVGGQSNPDSASDIAIDNAVVQWPVYYQYRNDSDGVFGAPDPDFPSDYCTSTANGGNPIRDNYELPKDDPTPHGVYCARQSFKIDKNNLSATITVLAPKIEINANHLDLRYFDTTRRLLFFSTRVSSPFASYASGQQCPSADYLLKVDGNNFDLEGVVFAPCSGITLNGNSGASFTGLIAGQAVAVDGNSFTLVGTGGGGGATTREIALIE
jgi:Flp pilus assembly protein TadG